MSLIPILPFLTVTLAQSINVVTNLNVTDTIIPDVNPIHIQISNYEPPFSRFTSNVPSYKVAFCLGKRHNELKFGNRKRYHYRIWYYPYEFDYNSCVSTKELNDFNKNHINNKSYNTTMTIDFSKVKENENYYLVLWKKSIGKNSYHVKLYVEILVKIYSYTAYAKPFKFCNEIKYFQQLQKLNVETKNLRKEYSPDWNINSYCKFLQKLIRDEKLKKKNHEKEKELEKLGIKTENLMKKIKISSFEDYYTKYLPKRLETEKAKINDLIQELKELHPKSDFETLRKSWIENMKKGQTLAEYLSDYAEEVKQKAKIELLKAKWKKECNESSYKGTFNEYLQQLVLVKQLELLNSEK